ncbi:MAG: PH domain-containing protein [Candidatus Thermoplasmatota archaeon]|jgi:hypothetical protein|nr:PH domain-containing protein [Candidatus Thermoplasmatota archaeon]MDP7264481.1 PH domain-containing protein [Candidatus Thermoplasmatota archaeon]
MSDVLEIEYKVSSGKIVKRITYFVVILFIFLGVGIPASIYLADGLSPVFLFTTVLMSVIYVSILAGSWAFSPRTYSVSEKTLKIKRPIKSITIPINTITSIEERDFKFTQLRKKMGNSGLFSIIGSFSIKGDGTVWFYAKNSNYVMIHADKKYVLSPDDRFMFMNQISKHIERYGNSSEKGDGVRFLMRKK